jgi:hypothetical protein
MDNVYNVATFLMLRVNVLINHMISVCPVPAEEWIPLRCSQISIRTNEQSRIEARTKCTELKARLFRIDTTWKINFISSVLQNCNGLSVF